MTPSTQTPDDAARSVEAASMQPGFIDYAALIDFVALIGDTMCMAAESRVHDKLRAALVMLEADMPGILRRAGIEGLASSDTKAAITAQREKERRCAAEAMGLRAEVGALQAEIEGMKVEIDACRTLMDVLG